MNIKILIRNCRGCWRLLEEKRLILLLNRKGRHLSEHTVNIMRVNSIFVHTNVIGSTYVIGSQSPVIYSFFPDIPPGGKIIVQPRVLIYLPVSLSVISRLTSW